MPSTVVAFFKSLPFIDIDVDVLGPLECYGVSGFKSELFFALFMPVVLISILLAFFMTWHIGRVCMLKVAKARSDARLDRMRQKITSRFQRSGAVKRLKRQQRLLATAALAAKPEKKEGLEPWDHARRHCGRLVQPLPHLLIVLYCVSPTAYNKAFSMYQCVTYEEMPETNLCTKSSAPREGGPRLPGPHISSRTCRRIACRTRRARYPNRTRGFGCWARSCSALLRRGALALHGLAHARAQAITDSMFEATNLSTALSFLYQDFKPVFFWWDFVDLIKKVALVGFFVTIKPGTLISSCSPRVSAWSSSARRRCPNRAKTSDNAVAMSCSFCLCFFFVCTIIIKVTSITDLIGASAPHRRRCSP